MNIVLAPGLREFVDHKVEQGGYASAEEVIAASLAMMQNGEDADWKSAAREKIEQGLRSAREGRVHEPTAVSV